MSAHWISFLLLISVTHTEFLRTGLEVHDPLSREVYDSLSIETGSKRSESSIFVHRKAEKKKESRKNSKKDHIPERPSNKHPDRNKPETPSASKSTCGQAVKRNFIKCKTDSECRRKTKGKCVFCVRERCSKSKEKAQWYERTQAKFNNRTNLGRVWIPGQNASVYIGTAAYYVRKDKATNRFITELGNIAVIPSRQGQGVSKALMKRFIVEARRNRPDIDTVKLFVLGGHNNTSAIGLYRKFGFGWVTDDEAARNATSNYWMTLDLDTYVEPPGIH
ncbi:acetyltransferase (GNAT) family domain-containing protein [Ditylenchus destructor]|uniref:Acetyltransferase (GNAT) family domain-containing protein n=1 Tax=Ditylenchus destructor TaxID=166010 RepID=A0AAD4MYQ4_9BILA|nr:acetyltransferase (GNAT) family domain-containing protein [Ditylenchus destructor]